MSYINFSITHTSPSFTAMTYTYDAGFSREGGRLEHASRLDTSKGPLAPTTRSAQLTDDVTATGAGLLDALRAISWVQEVVVEHGDGAQPNLVTWNLRHGGSGTGLAGSLPTGIQNVLDAASLFTKAVDAAPTLVPYAPHA
jgi:hypothetical protein